MMNPDILEHYIEKVYGYAVNHTYSRGEADELSQEIMYTALRNLPKLRDEKRFEPWLWGIADNVIKSFRRSMGKQRAMYSYDVIPEQAYEESFDEAQEEMYDFLRTKIAMLSEIYRNIIILHYYDGLSTKKISKKLNVPEGTVTWRLSEARKKLKKECQGMNETALRPIRMRINIYGNGDYNGTSKPFPTVYIDDALSQNVLYYCYEQPKSIEELAKLCGVPAYYIEDRIDNLLRRQAVIEASKGKYQTDFIIWSDKYGIYCEENAERALMPIMDDLIGALKSISGEAMQIDFYKAEKSENDLFYLFGALAFEYVGKKYCKLPHPDFKTKYDGNQWCYIGSMETGEHRRTGMTTQHCVNLGSRGRGSHTSFGEISGICFRPMMYDNYINACVDILIDGRSDDVDSVADAIKDGYIVRRDNGSLFVTTPMFTMEQTEKFSGIVEKHLTAFVPKYSAIIAEFVKGYKKLFPKHLNDDADRMCQGMFTGMYAAVIDYAQRTEKVSRPVSGCCCDVIRQFR